MEREREELKIKFLELYIALLADIRFSSNLDDLVKHLNYQKIIGLGKELIPVLLDQLEKNPSWGLILMLHELTGENPVREEHKGCFDDVRKDWLAWSIKI